MHGQAFADLAGEGTRHGPARSQNSWREEGREPRLPAERDTHTSSLVTRRATEGTRAALQTLCWRPGAISGDT